MPFEKKCNYCGRTYPTDISFCLDDGKPLVEVETLIGQVIDGRYRLDSLIGKGGMGDVYRATHVHIDSEFAVKLLKPEFVANETAIKRFRLEAKAAGRIQHPNAIRVTDFGVSPENIVYLVMDLITGYSLRSLMSNEGAIDYIRTVNIVRQICGAVDAAHRSGVIHRDIKPDNILIEMVSNNERVKVLDFGIAKLKETKAEAYLTQAGTIIGTPQYMSPEQCQGKEIDTRSDIYSIGIILYEMLAGRVPFDAVSPLQILYKHFNEAPQSLSEIVPHVPELLARVVSRAMEKNPADRPSTAYELGEELKSAIVTDDEAVLSFTDPLIPPPINVANLRTPVPGATPTGEPVRPARSIETKPISPLGTGDSAASSVRTGGSDPGRDTGSGARMTALDHRRVTPPEHIETGPTQVYPAAEKKSRMPLIVMAAVAVIAIIASGLIYWTMKPSAVPVISTVKPSVPEGMVMIEGGKFLMGRDDGASDEGPVHEVEIKSFLIDIQEVTNQDYKKFIDASSHPVPKPWRKSGSYAPAEALFPVTYVNWNDAVAYAKWANKRLPTEAEWEYTARGGNKGFIYPWGNDWRNGFANVDNKVLPRPAPVRSYVRDVSPFGVNDMAGNVSEWVQDFYSMRYGASPDTRLRVYRGGNFLDSPEKSTNTFRWSDFPGDTPEDQILRVGFRCAKDLE